MDRNTASTARWRRCFVCALALVGSRPAWAQWSFEEFKLLPADVGFLDTFGHAVAVGSGYIAVSAVFDDDCGENCGAVYLFDEESGQLMSKLHPLASEGVLAFGRSVSIGGGMMAVGADDRAFVTELGSGGYLTELIALDTSPGDQFGYAIALESDRIAVGASRHDAVAQDAGAVFLFDVVSGVQLREFMPPYTNILQKFGGAVGLSDDSVAIGSTGGDNPVQNGGAAYVYDAATGQMMAQLIPDDLAYGDEFGFAIAIADGIVAVGAPGDDNANGSNAGAVYVFDAATGSQIRKIIAADPEPFSGRMGHSVSLSDGLVAAGMTRGYVGGVIAGAVYLFDIDSGDQIARFGASDGTSDDKLGSSVGLYFGRIVAGAPSDRKQGQQSGSAYMFSAQCPADWNRDGQFYTNDFVAYLNDYNAMAGGGAPTYGNADLAPPVGTLNTADFIAYLNLYAAGCP